MHRFDGLGFEAGEEKNRLQCTDVGILLRRKQTTAVLFASIASEVLPLRFFPSVLCSAPLLHSDFLPNQLYWKQVSCQDHRSLMKQSEFAHAGSTLPDQV